MSLSLVTSPSTDYEIFRVSFINGGLVIQLSSDCKLLILYPTHGVMKEELACVDVCCMISYSCFHISLTGSRKRSLEEDEDFGAMQVTAAQNG